MHALAARLGVDLAEIFVDNDVSASKIRRDKTAWAQCLVYVRQHRPAYLLAWKMDRLGRRLADLEGLDDLARETGTKVHTTKDGDVFANPARPFLAAQAKMEARNTGDRIRRMQESRRARGVDGGGGWRPFGYESDRMTVRPSEAEEIQRLAERIINGESATQLARDLNERGVKPVSGSVWQANVVRRVMGNPRYAGHLQHKGEIIGKGSWPVILDRRTHEAVKQALDASAMPLGGRAPTSLLGGIVRCSKCKTVMAAAHAGKDPDGKAQEIYRCNRRIGGCGNVSRKRSLVDDYVTSKILATVSFSKVDAAIDELETLLDARDQESVDLDMDLYVLSAEFEAGSVLAADYYPKFDAMRRRQRKVDADRKDLLPRFNQAVRNKRAHAHWHAMTVDERRAFLKDHIVTVLVYPTRRRGRAAGQGHRLR